MSFIFFVALSFLTYAQESTNCLAVITDMSGEVIIQKAQTKERKAVWGTQLYERDVIKTSKGSRATLLFSNGNLINLGANSSIEISISNKTTAEADTKSEKVSKVMVTNFLTLTNKRKKDKEVGVLAGKRSVNTIQTVELISPCNTLIKTTRPSFSWHTRESIDEFEIKLYNGKGLLWSRKVSDNKLAFPDNEQDLEYGESYFWHVEGDVMLESYKSLNHEFSILSTDRINEVAEQEEDIKDFFKGDLNSSTYHSAIGAYYMDIGLHEEAIEEFLLVSEINQQAALPHEILGKLYTYVGKKDQAISELHKALELAKKEE